MKPINLPDCTGQRTNNGTFQPPEAYLWLAVNTINNLLGRKTITKNIITNNN
jgi:hypothetical protein